MKLFAFLKNGIASSSIFTFTFLTIIIACSKEEKIEEVAILNSFKMNINNEEWVPYTPADNPCRSTFSAEITWIDAPFYDIDVYNDPEGDVTIFSETIFRLRITTLNKLGPYNITGSFYSSDFESYVAFFDSRNETIESPSKKYLNKKDDVSFVVEIEEFYPIKNSDLVGIKGSFGGILYNQNDEADSLIINDGKFVFKVLNTPGFYNCEL